MRTFRTAFARLCLWPFWLSRTVIGRGWPVRLAAALVVLTTTTLGTAITAPVSAVWWGTRLRAWLTPPTMAMAIPVFAVFIVAVAPLEGLSSALRCAWGCEMSPVVNEALDYLFGEDRRPTPVEHGRDDDDEFGGGAGATATAR